MNRDKINKTCMPNEHVTVCLKLYYIRDRKKKATTSEKKLIKLFETMPRNQEAHIVFLDIFWKRRFAAGGMSRVCHRLMLKD